MKEFVTIHDINGIEHLINPRLIAQIEGLVNFEDTLKLHMPSGDVITVAHTQQVLKQIGLLNDYFLQYLQKGAKVLYKDGMGEKQEGFIRETPIKHKRWNQLGYDYGYDYYVSHGAKVIDYSVKQRLFPTFLRDIIRIIKPADKRNY